MSLNTQGFRVSRLPDFQAMDPRLLVADHSGLSQGLNQGVLSFLDRIERAPDIARQRRLADLQLQAAELETAALPDTIQNRQELARLQAERSRLENMFLPERFEREGESHRLDTAARMAALDFLPTRQQMEIENQALNRDASMLANQARQLAIQEEANRIQQRADREQRLQELFAELDANPVTTQSIPEFDDEGNLIGEAEQLNPDMQRRQAVQQLRSLTQASLGREPTLEEVESLLSPQQGQPARHSTLTANQLATQGNRLVRFAQEKRANGSLTAEDGERLWSNLIAMYGSPENARGAGFDRSMFMPMAGGSSTASGDERTQRARSLLNSGLLSQEDRQALETAITTFEAGGNSLIVGLARNQIDEILNRHRDVSIDSTRQSANDQQPIALRRGEDRVFDIDLRN